MLGRVRLLEPLTACDHGRSSVPSSRKAVLRVRAAPDNEMAASRGTKRPPEGETITVGRRIFCNNLSWDVSWQDLKDFFAQAGTVQYADVLRETNGRSKGCGIVEFADSSSAAQAIQTLNEAEFKGRPMFIREDRDDKELRGDRAEPSGPRLLAKRGRVQADVGGAVVGRRLFVRGLSSDTDWQRLKDHFRAAGSVLHADVLQDNGASRGCGTVEMSTPAEALQAISLLSNTELDGRVISVREDRDAARQGSRQAAGGGGSREVYFTPRVQAMAGNSSSGRQIVVHGLPFSMRWQAFKDLMRQSGTVVRVDIATDPSGRSRGFGTALFETEAEAQAAIEAWNGTEYEGRTLGVKLDQFA